MYELDIVNSNPRLLYRFLSAKRPGCESAYPTPRRYCAHAEDRASAIVEYYSISIEVAEILLIRMLFGGDYEVSQSPNVLHGVRKLQYERQLATADLTEGPALSPILTSSRIKGPEWPMYSALLISRGCMEYDAAQVDRGHYSVHGT